MKRDEVFTGKRVRLDGDGDLIVTYVFAHSDNVRVCPFSIYLEIVGHTYRPDMHGGKSSVDQLYGREPVSVDRLT